MAAMDISLIDARINVVAHMKLMDCVTSVEVYPNVLSVRVSGQVDVISAVNAGPSPRCTCTHQVTLGLREASNEIVANVEMLNVARAMVRSNVRI